MDSLAHNNIEIQPIAGSGIKHSAESRSNDWTSIKAPEPPTFSKDTSKPIDQISPEPDAKEDETNSEKVDVVANKAVEEFKNSPTVKELQELKDQGKMKTTPEEVKEMEKKTGMTRREVLSLLILLSLDVTFNQGRGLSEFFEAFMHNTMNKKIFRPVMKKMGLDEKTINSLLDKGKTASKGVFQLEKNTLKVVLENMTDAQRQDLVKSLAPEEQTALLFSETPKDPFNRLTPIEIHELFNEKKLGKDFLLKLKTTLAVSKESK